MLPCPVRHEFLSQKLAIVNHFTHKNKRLLFFFLLASLLFALYMWLVEGLSLLDTYYFLVATATTVGYGDASPVTPLGKVCAGVIAVLGIGMFALPTSILGAAFVEELSSGTKRSRCPHCDEEL